MSHLSKIIQREQTQGLKVTELSKIALITKQKQSFRDILSARYKGNNAKEPVLLEKIRKREKFCERALNYGIRSFTVILLLFI